MRGNKFQIWKDGKPLDQSSYEDLGQASLEWVQHTHGKEVVEVDVEGKYVRSVPELECHEAITSDVTLSLSRTPPVVTTRNGR
jgi:hypothetical protein